MFHSLISDQSPKAFQFPLLQLVLLITFHLMFCNEKEKPSGARGIGTIVICNRKTFITTFFLFPALLYTGGWVEASSEGMNDWKKIKVAGTTPKRKITQTQSSIIFSFEIIFSIHEKSANYCEEFYSSE